MDDTAAAAVTEDAAVGSVDVAPWSAPQETAARPAAAATDETPAAEPFPPVLPGDEPPLEEARNESDRPTIPEPAMPESAAPEPAAPAPAEAAPAATTPAEPPRRGWWRRLAQ